MAVRKQDAYNQISGTFRMKANATHTTLSSAIPRDWRWRRDGLPLLSLTAGQSLMASGGKLKEGLG